MQQQQQQQLLLQLMLLLLLPGVLLDTPSAKEKAKKS